MATFQTPADNSKIIQSNEGEVFGDLASTFNIDLVSNKGKIKGSRKLIRSTDEDDNSDLEKVAQFKKFGNKIYALSDELFSVSLVSGDLTSSWTDEAVGTAFDGNKDDMEVFDSKLLISYVAGGDDIGAWDGNSFDDDWYTNVIGGSFTNSDVPHPMEVATIGSPLLCIGDGNRLNTVTEGGTPTDGRLVLREDQHIKWIRSGRSSVWIGCVNTEGGEGIIYEWDGGANLPTRAYKAGAEGSYACEIFNDVPIVVTSDGAIRQLTGNGFEVVAFFPVYKTGVSLASSGVNNVDFVHPNGMKQLRNEILIATEGKWAENEPSAFPSGVWAYVPQTGNLYHKYSPTLGLNDYGQQRVAGTGAIYVTKNQTESSILASFDTYPGSAESSNKYAIFYEDLKDNQRHVGWFETPEIHTNNVTENWQEFIHQVSKIPSGDDEIVVKYRTEKQEPVELDITWSNNTTFTTTDDLSNVNEGDEVCIVQGVFAGQCAHVVNITNNTVFLDRSIGGNSGTSVALVSNYEKLTTIDSDSFQGEAKEIPAKADIFIQYKVYFDGSGDNPELYKLITSTEFHQAA